MLAPSSSMGSLVWKSILDDRDTLLNLLKNWSMEQIFEIPRGFLTGFKLPQSQHMSQTIKLVFELILTKPRRWNR